MLQIERVPERLQQARMLYERGLQNIGFITYPRDLNTSQWEMGSYLSHKKRFSSGVDDKCRGSWTKKGSLFTTRKAKSCVEKENNNLLHGLVSSQSQLCNYNHDQIKIIANLQEKRVRRVKTCSTGRAGRSAKPPSPRGESDRARLAWEHRTGQWQDEVHSTKADWKKQLEELNTGAVRKD